MVFVDTSAIYALLDGSDSNHDAVMDAWPTLVGRRVRLVTTNYVLVESYALLQRRLGMSVVRDHYELAQTLNTEWISPSQHLEAVHLLLASNRRSLSLVDCSSFVWMRNAGVSSALCLDKHFAEQGFDLIPQPR